MIIQKHLTLVGLFIWERLFLFATAMIIILFSFMPTQGVAASETISINIDSTNVSYSKDDGFGEPFIDSRNRVQVPIRKTLETIGANVEYSDSERTVIITKHDITLRFEIDGKTWLNGKPYEIDTSAVIIDGRAYLPIRYIVEPIGYSVKWDGRKNIVLIRQPVYEVWTSPSEAGTVSMLNGPIGLVFSGPDGEVEEWEFYSFDRPHVSIFNITNIGASANIVLEPVKLEYRLFRMTDKGDELLYSKSYPDFSGSMPTGTFVSCIMEIPYWTWENLTPGTYKIQLVFPNNFEYRFADDETIHYLPIKSNMYNEFYEFIIK